MQYIRIMKKLHAIQSILRRKKAIKDILIAFDNVIKYEKGKKKLKSAKELLNEL